MLISIRLIRLILFYLFNKLDFFICKITKNAFVFRKQIINGHAKESLRLIDWFVTNYAKKNFIGYDLVDKHGRTKRFKV
ncbi:MAG: hypothetical protein ABGY41_13380, partial [Candidatus Poribacteria bacterium]